VTYSSFISNYRKGDKMDANEFYKFSESVISDTAVKYTGYSNISRIDALQNAIYIMEETEK